MMRRSPPWDRLFGRSRYPGDAKVFERFGKLRGGVRGFDF
jgi:hypothetical protein